MATDIADPAARGLRELLGDKTFTSMMALGVELTNSKKNIAKARAIPTAHGQKLAAEWQLAFDAKEKIYLQLIGKSYPPERLAKGILCAVEKGHLTLLAKAIATAPLNVVCLSSDDVRGWADHPLIQCTMHGFVEGVRVLLSAKTPWTGDQEIDNHFLDLLGMLFTAMERPPRDMGELFAAMEDTPREGYVQCIELIVESYNRFRRHREHRCLGCGETAEINGLERLLQCSACNHGASYCSKQCQKKDWPLHKEACKEARQMVAMRQALADWEGPFGMRIDLSAPGLSPYWPNSDDVPEPEPTRRNHPSTLPALPELVAAARARHEEMKRRHDDRVAAEAEEAKKAELEKRERVAAERARRAAQPESPLTPRGPSHKGKASSAKASPTTEERTKRVVAKEASLVMQRKHEAELEAKEQMRIAQIEERAESRKVGDRIAHGD